MKTSYLLFIAILLMATTQSCRKSKHDLIEPKRPTPVTEKICNTINTFIATNDTTIVNTTVGDTVFTTVVIKHRMDTVSNTICDNIAEPTVYRNGQPWTESYTFIDHVIQNNNNNNNNNNNGQSGTWLINASDLGLTSSTWVPSVGVTNVTNTGTCWLKGNTVATLKLSEQTWASLHNDAITNYSTGIIVRNAGVNAYGDNIIAVDRYVQNGSICQ